MPQEASSGGGVSVGKCRMLWEAACLHVLNVGADQYEQLLKSSLICLCMYIYCMWVQKMLLKVKAVQWLNGSIGKYQCGVK